MTSICCKHFIDLIAAVYFQAAQWEVLTPDSFSICTGRGEEGRMSIPESLHFEVFSAPAILDLCHLYVFQRKGGEWYGKGCLSYIISYPIPLREQMH